MGLVTGIEVDSPLARGHVGIDAYRPRGSRIVKNEGAGTVVKERTVVFESHCPPLTRVFSAKFDIMRLVVDGLGKLCNAAATARSKWECNSSFTVLLFRPVLAREGPSRGGCIAD